MIPALKAVLILIAICAFIHLVAIIAIIFKIVDAFSYILGWFSGILVGLIILILIAIAVVPSEAKKILESLFSKIL